MRRIAPRAVAVLDRLNKKTPPLKEALRKEVSPSAFVISRNDWIVGKKTIILESYKMERYIYNEKNGL